MEFSIIAAVGQNDELGFNGANPWPKIKQDLRHFRDVTLGPEGSFNAVIMGRKTWDAVGLLKNRLNIVITSNPQNIHDALGVKSLEEAFKLAQDHNVNGVWIIGGGSIFKLALRYPQFLKEYHQTIVYGEYKADTWFPQVPESYKWDIKSTGPKTTQD